MGGPTETTGKDLGTLGVSGAGAWRVQGHSTSSPPLQRAKYRRAGKRRLPFKAGMGEGLRRREGWEEAAKTWAIPVRGLLWDRVREWAWSLRKAAPIGVSKLC